MNSPLPWTIDQRDSSSVRDSNGELVIEHYRILHSDDFDKIISMVSNPSGWRPIETAPRDGSLIILCWSNSRNNQHNWYHIGKWGQTSKQSRYFWLDCTGYPIDIDWENPTHWMPLSGPPEV